MKTHRKIALVLAVLVLAVSLIPSWRMASTCGRTVGDAVGAKMAEELTRYLQLGEVSHSCSFFSAGNAERALGYTWQPIFGLSAASLIILIVFMKD